MNKKYIDMSWEELISQADTSTDPLIWELAQRFGALTKRNIELGEAYREVHRKYVILRG